MKKPILATICLICLSRCVSSPITQAPLPEIQRNYTVPEDSSKWIVTLPLGFSTDPNGEINFFDYPQIFSWEFPLTNYWSLIIDPLPLGFAFQIWNTDSSRLGFQFGTRATYSTQAQIRVQPYFESSLRYKLSKSLALDTRFFAHGDIGIKKVPEESAHGLSGLEFGFVNQLEPKLALSSSLLLVSQNGRFFKNYYWLENKNFSPAQDRWIGFTFKYQCQISPAWELSQSASYTGIASKNNAASLYSEFVLTYTWL